MILYPTETIYGIGVNPFASAAMQAMFDLKGRDERKVASWLVRSIEDIEHFAIMSDRARVIAKNFLPGPLTLVLPAKDIVPTSLRSEEGTIGIRISSDPLAQALIERFWKEHKAPLTCTSANVSGCDTADTPAEIIEQFAKARPDFTGFTEVIDGGKRGGIASTVVKVIDNEVTVARLGAITTEAILSAR